MHIPAFYNADSVETLPLKIKWLQQEFGLTDSFFANLLRVREDLFNEWKEGGHTLTVRQLDCLRKFWTSVTHILSFLNYQKDLVQVMLEFEDKTFVGSRSAFTPPWVGSSLKEFLEHAGVEGVEQVNDWIQSMTFASSF